MKTALKILTFFLIIIITIASCESYTDNHNNKKAPDPDDLNKLHIRPTKPIRIPDTMTIRTMRVITYEDTIP